jgi:hypothetical protein
MQHDETDRRGCLRIRIASKSERIGARHAR